MSVEASERTETYDIWRSMFRRCYYPTAPDYEGAGVNVCNRWCGLYGFEHFLEDMGEVPRTRTYGDHRGRDYTLERIDRTDDYAPENCRWVAKQPTAPATPPKRKRTETRIAGERRRHARVRAKGFWVPCTCCGEWRHRHSKPNPSMVIHAWKQPCMTCVGRKQPTATFTVDSLGVVVATVQPVVQPVVQGKRQCAAPDCTVEFELTSHRRHRKWCTERCRKRTLYGGICIDCGNPCDGASRRKKSVRCKRCAPAAQEKKWSLDECQQAVVAWTEQHGRPPAAEDTKHEPTLPTWNVAAIREAGGWRQWMIEIGLKSPDDRSGAGRGPYSVTEEDVRQAIESYRAHGSAQAAATVLNVSAATVRGRMRKSLEGIELLKANGSNSSSNSNGKRHSPATGLQHERERLAAELQVKQTEVAALERAVEALDEALDALRPLSR